MLPVPLNQTRKFKQVNQRTLTTARRAAVLLLAALFLTAPTAVLAQDAGAYLDKLLQMYDSPFSANYGMTMNVNQGGMSMSMDGSGSMTFRDETHMVMSMELNMKMPGSDQGMAMNVRTISDGTTSWTEMDNPMMGKQVLKMDIAKAKEMSQQGMSANAGSSPIEQLRTFQQYYDFTVAGKTGGNVTLTGTLKPDAPDSIKQGGAMVENMTVVMEESTGRLQRFELGPAGEPAMVMTMNDYKKLSASDVPDSMFAYTPPAGVTVIDPLAMSQQ